MIELLLDLGVDAVLEFEHIQLASQEDAQQPEPGLWIELFQQPLALSLLEVE